MNTQTEPRFHTVEEEWLAAYSAGGLSPAKRLIIACQAAINPRLSNSLSNMDTVGGVLLETAKGDALSDTFMTRLFDRMDTPDAAAPEDIISNTLAPTRSWVPAPLTDFMSRAGKGLTWKNMGFGMARVPIMQDGREKLYLLKSPAGKKMPLHSHHGEEWALILQGGYHVGAEGYVRGDVHREDETCTHRPLIDDHGEDCITLVAAEGGLKFSNPLLGLLKPILGI